MTFVAGMVVILVGVFSLVCGLLLMQETFARKLSRWLMSMFGVQVDKLPKSVVLPDPLKPHVMQSRIAGIMFVALGVYLLGTGLFVLGR